ncbi:hypothetical protein [Azospirillum sp. ST 5-10]|uniref:hypothetical protein n=1 Tax=unclassified Azospirillum TaxID=2630922 RepID=UPI003F49BDCE
MSADGPHTPHPRPPSTGIAKPPLCDELSGGGGSATDTRDRAIPGSRPTGIKGDCTPYPVPRPERTEG